MTWCRSMKILVSTLALVGAWHLPGWDLRDEDRRQSEKLTNVVENRSQWRDRCAACLQNSCS